MKKYWPVIISIFFVVGIFLIANLAHSENTDIVITEIGAYESDNHEWIEIYNKGDDDVDIEGWKFLVEGESKHGINLTSSTDSFIINPGEYVIISENDINFLEDYLDFSGRVFDSSWGGINEDGNKKIGLEDDDGVEVEYFNYPPALDYSLERKDVNELASDESNWQEYPDGNTVGAENHWRVDNMEDTEHGDEENTDDAEDNDGTTSSTLLNLVINEFVPNPNDEEKEWVEIFNVGTSTIDLTGWTLSDAVSVRNSPTGTIQAGTYYIIELNNVLNNSGDTIILKNPTEDIVDQVQYDSGADNAPVPAKGNSVARNVDGQDTDNDKNDWAETTTPIKGEINIITAPVANTPAPTSGGGGGSTIIPTITYSVGSIIINELVSDPGDDKEEFVELYNKTFGSVNLSGWWLEDGSETKTSLNGSVSAGGFFVIEKPKGNLNNAGDIIILFALDGKEIDKVTYGTWDDGNINDNAVAPDDPLSLARKVDGQDSNNDYYDFVLTSTITKGKSNIISSVTKDGEVIEQILTSAKIVINEILPNPTGSDNDEEFIELKNIGTETINLKDWQLSDSGTRKYKITQGSVSAGGYIVFKRSMTGIALNNTGGDEVKLYSPSGSLVDNIKYSGKADDDTSYSRLDDGGWKWTTKLTPGKDNIIEGKSAAPIISIDVDTEVAVGETIMFDASDTDDPDGETMSFVWDFNDGSEGVGVVVGHTFNTEGVFTVKLNVVNASNSIAEKKVIITVKNRLAFVGGYDGNNNIMKIVISEFVPNPTGSDTTEFIELYNPTEDDLDLSDFKLDDEDGGSRAYTFPVDTIISAGAYVIFGRQDTKLALNNTSDSVRLLYPDGTVLKEVGYDDVPEGASYVQDENEVWQWTGINTPGEANVINAVVEKTTVRKVSKSKYVKPLINTTLEKLRDEDVGDKVRVAGVVAVEPGILGTQYFYIVGSPGVQVYMYKKDFPNLKVGDRIEVTGEITESYGNTRIKLATKDDIKKIDHPGDPQPKIVDIADIGEPLEGWLIEINGEITEIKGSYIYVDDGTEEVQVYFKTGTGINKKILQVGDLVSVTGLVYQTKSGYQVLPRNQEDIVKTGVAETAVVQIAASEEEGKKEVAEKYLTATAGGLTSILFGLFAKARGATALSFLKKFGGLAVAVIRRRPRV